MKSKLPTHQLINTYLIPYHPEYELWKKQAFESKKNKPKHPTSFSIHLRQPTASYHDSFQDKIAESCPKREYNGDYQGTNIWHQQTYKLNTRLKLRAYIKLYSQIREANIHD